MGLYAPRKRVAAIIPQSRIEWMHTHTFWGCNAWTEMKRRFVIVEFIDKGEEEKEKRVVYSEMRGEGGGRERGLREATAAADFFPRVTRRGERGGGVVAKYFFA